MTHDTDHENTATIDPVLLEVLVCPVTHGPLDYDRVNQELISRQLAKAFPVRNGVPVMLVEEARDLENLDGGIGDGKDNRL
ncbi:MAG: Trm112 family protein [Bacteroidetes bacterium]|nr:Trm112 family protein [Bacteroidota bacterium]